MTSLAALGRPSLVAALGFALGAVAFGVVGGGRGLPGPAEASRRCLRVAAAGTAAATIALVSALFAHDFSLEYVVRYSSRSLSGPYTLSALWGGMEGSLLFWTLLLTVFSVLALRRPGGAPSQAWAGAVLAGVSSFFLLLLVGPADPFTTLAPPADGSGLNPLLQSPGMLVHPPLLYTGLVGLSIPFAFAMGALLARGHEETWLVSTRRWTLFAWSALSIGIVLGGAWAYSELGWGGYWAWDPVENASFMPWLTATAYLHSVVVQEKRRMLKVWNVSLILVTYALAIFGTFLTRSGLLSSIHTFTEGPIGKWFLPFLGVLLIGGLAVIAARLDSLRAENRLDSLLSRESAFLANNVLFVAAALAVLWGTIYPIVAETFTGVRLSVGPPFFNAVFVPIALALLALTGIGPLVSWRRMSKGAFARIVRAPAAAGGGCIVVLAVGGVRSPGALLAFGLCAFVTASIAGEFARAARAHRRRTGGGWVEALGHTVLRNRRRYGGYIVHLGVVLLVIGLAGNAFKTERRAELARGESMRVGDYTLTYEGLRQDETAEKQIAAARISVARGGRDLGTLWPQRNFHIAQRQPQSEVAIRTTPVEDLYLVVTSFSARGDAALRAFVNPLTWWIWAGAAVMAFGMSVIISGPTPSPARAPAAAPL
ncbi:MAG TPA: heme lyase CcmF/NrfE family subunit, partial [Actinomycetota bacterium]|nr:heme lyase CcmF/NrfE family subunit [Actinomycetota bacterium]